MQALIPRPGAGFAASLCTVLLWGAVSNAAVAPGSTANWQDLA